MSNMKTFFRAYFYCKPSEEAQNKTAIYLDSDWCRSYLRIRRRGLLFSFIPLFKYGFLFLQRYFGINAPITKRAAYSEQAFRKNLGKANGVQQSTSATDFGSGYGYEDEQTDLKVAQFYKNEFLTNTFSARETPILNERAFQDICRILDKGDINTVINFGVCYAALDHKIALKYPHVKFVGLDRSEFVMDLNRQDFKLPNMEFVAGDVLDWVTNQEDLSKSLFFSIRIQVLLPRSFIFNLYRFLSEKGCSRISIFEPFGLSRETNDIYLNQNELTDSVLYRDTMYLHNYQAIAYNCNYLLELMDYVKTDHIDKDQRIQVAHFCIDK